MAEGKIKTNGVGLWYEDFGKPADPAVLMIMGAGGQAIMWPLELIKPIVEAGYRVIRFDNRDIGLSMWIDDFEAHPYTLADMAVDAIGLLDAINIKRAHIIGASMGGMIAQLAAIQYPQRVLSLTSWMSTYAVNDPDIPAMTDEVQALAATALTSPPQTREGIIEFQVRLFKTLSGSRFPFKEREFRAMMDASIERGHNPNCHHGPAALASPSRLDALRNLAVPTLVIHGTEDPIINYILGVVCAKVIPGARLHTQKGVGHEIPPEILSETTPIILEHLGSAP